jgi:hypothetical protein
MALHWRPLGPEPAETYWRRRALVAAALLAVLALLVWTVGSLGGDGDEPDRLATDPSPSAAAPDPSPSPVSAAPTPDPSATATPSATPSAEVACEDAALDLATVADKESYGVGERPRLELRVTNTGAAPCSLDLGQAAVELIVVSGSDRIWSSDDCDPGGEAEVVPLAPGEPVSRRVTWGGKRSLPGCEGPKAQAQPGTYRVTGRVGEREAGGATFQITG